MSNLKITNEGVMLCCGKAACPTIARADDSLIGGFVIKDDFGGSVTLSSEEIKVLPDAALLVVKSSPFAPETPKEFGPFANPPVR